MTNTIPIPVIYYPSSFCDLFLLNFENTSCHSIFLFTLLIKKMLMHWQVLEFFCLLFFLKFKVRSCTDVLGLFLQSQTLSL